MGTIKSHYTLVIIGGGVTGAAIAQQASKKGISTLLLEKTTFGAGASSKTSKLAHGGLRYLEQFEFKLVKESLTERDLLLKTYPDLVKPLPFLLPVYKGFRKPFWQVKIGLTLYDWFSEKGPLPSHENLSKQTLSNKIPFLKTEGLVGGCIYYDAQMDDLGLNRLLIQMATQSGAHCFEHSPATKFITHNNKIKGIQFLKEGVQHKITADHIINATGAWSNELSKLTPKPQKFVAPTKGCHIVLKDIGLKTAILLTAPQDKRVFFIMPWQNKTLVGTTDTSFSKDPDSVQVTEKDIRYLLTATNHYLTLPNFTKKDILDAFAGLRPLLYSKKSSSERSRDFVVEKDHFGLTHVLGGKYTIHRLMAEKTLKKLGL